MKIPLIIKDARCKALHFSAGWTYCQIAEHQNLAVGTVYNICNAPATTKKRKGRPLSIDTSTHQRLVSIATMSAAHRQMPLAKIAALCGVQACDCTLVKAFRQEGYARRVTWKKPLLDAWRKGLQLEFAQTHRHWTVEDWHRVVWTDESYIWLSGTCWRTRVTQRLGQEYEELLLRYHISKKKHDHNIG